MPNDKQIGKRILLTGIIVLAGASPLISCGLTEWQREQDIVQAHFKEHFKQFESKEFKEQIEKERMK